MFYDNDSIKMIILSTFEKQPAFETHFNTQCSKINEKMGQESKQTHLINRTHSLNRSLTNTKIHTKMYVHTHSYANTVTHSHTHSYKH
jgi:hypothetical protein